MIEDLLKGFLLQMQFLTRAPLPVHIEFNDRAFARGVVFAPLIGLCIGGISAGAYILVGLLENRTLAVLAGLVAEIAASGGLHLDGLADTCDGLFSNRDRDGMLAIMKDSRLGTNGAIALIILVLLKYVMLLSIPDAQFIACLLVMPALSRMAIAWIAGISAYAGKDKRSVACGLIKNTGAGEIAGATAASLIIGALIINSAVAPLAAAIILFSFLVMIYTRKKIGGITGDIIGAVVESSEIVFLFGILVLAKI
jgi:adenosylcobinamide-GDP ribazoletransferase